MSHHKQRLPFRYLEPAFFGGLLDDPLLFLRIRPLRRALLFDCGQITHLAKRVVKHIDTVFISHAHMDHVMGVPTLIRHHHASPIPLHLYGPPGIAERVGHQIRGYDWNLCEAYWFTLHVHEVWPDHISRHRFAGPEAFAHYHDGDEPRTSREIWSCRYVTVAAEQLDHKLPTLCFRITERPPFTIDPGRLEAAKLAPGEWIRDLKSRVWKGIEERSVALEDGGEPVADPAALYESIRGETACASLGYLSDVGWTQENRAVMEEFLGGLTLLCAECTFLRGEVEKARTSYHLCSDDLNELTGKLAPRFLLPMHLSKSYLYRTVDLYGELCPPSGTTLLRLPNHIVPPPLMVEDVAGWLRPGRVD